MIQINRHCRNDRGYVKLSKLFQIHLWQFDGHKRLLWPVEIGKVVAHTMLNTYICIEYKL